MLAVRWCLRFGLSYRDVEELLAERGIEVDHVSVYRWVQPFTPLLIDAARPCRLSPAIDGLPCQSRRKMDLSVPGDRPVWLGHRCARSPKRDLAATHRFLTRALEHSPRPSRGEH